MFDPEFYPTPTLLAHRMVSPIRDAACWLEPSAGKGNIADVIRELRREPRIDTIEQNPELAATLIGKGYPVLADDWLSYSGLCYYDAIVMNPPFSNAEQHILKAWDFLHAGDIVALLPTRMVAEPAHIQERLLANLITTQNGTVENLGPVFRNAERMTSVDVSLLRLKKIAVDDSLDLWANVSQEKDAPAEAPDDQFLATPDQLGNMEHYFNSATNHMVEAIRHLRRAAVYLAANGIKTSAHNDAYAQIAAMGLTNINTAMASFASQHRRDAWFQVFEKMEFRKWLDKQQREEFLRDVEKNGNVPFTAENIKGTLQNVFLQRRKLFEKSVANVFDELCRFYKGNGNHSEGWKTNSSYKVNRKLVFPWGCEFDSKFFRYFSLRYGHGNIDIYNDLDRILCVLAGRDFAKCRTVETALHEKFRALGHGVTTPFDNTAQSDFFDMKFWMKGTVHLSFHDKDLWEKFNVTAAAGKKWIGEGN